MRRQHAQQVVADAFGYPGIVCTTVESLGRDVMPGCKVGTPLPSAGCDCPWPGDDGNWTRWQTVVTNLATQAQAAGMDIMWDVSAV